MDESGTRDAHRTFTARTARVASPDAAPPASSSDSSPNASTPREAENDTRGQALPGDRGPARRSREGREEGSQRPSFWRRIALGRRPASEESPPDDADAGALQRTRQIASRIAASATPLAPRPSAPPEAQPEAVAREVERRIVEPMLQALVSVESKLERSHVDLLGRSDQIEQRLSQLWDIDEQLGALGDLQESLQRVSEQQRRLESAIHAQTRALRWVVGAVALSLAVAAFVVAALLP